ncbi:MAG: hypothetical protein M9962_03670 [Oligoflexia bacterium]|nr:hypothetical protein [Oligoflexia bacterium]
MKKILFFMFLFPLITQAADWKTSFGGELELEGVYWVSGKVLPDKQVARPIVSLKIPSTIRYGRRWRLRLLPNMQADPTNESKRERYFFDPQEAYFQYQSLPWTVQLGFNVHTWGDTDVFNPLDVVNPRRYFDPFRSEKLGSPGLLVKREFEKLFIELLYIPVQRKTLLPGEKSRWMPRDVYKSRSVGTSFGSGRIILPTNMNYQYLDSLELDDALKNNFGARFKFRFSGFDWTVAGFYGAATTPAVNLRRVTATATTLLPELTFVVDPDIFLQAAYYKSRMLGTSFVWVLFDDYLVKGAVANSKPVSSRRDLPLETWESVLGIERSFALGKGSITVLAQATYVDRGDAVDTNSVSLSRMFDKAGMLGLRWSPNEKWTAVASYLRDIKFEGSVIHSDISYKLADGWKTKIAGDLLDGKTETPIGTYRKNDRLTLSIQRQW